jgi:hypothetical protein
MPPSALFVLVLYFLLFFSKTNTKVLKKTFQLACTVLTKCLHSDKSLALKNSSTQRCTKSQKEFLLYSEFNTLLSWCEMWATSCCSVDRPVSAGGSLTCSTLTWEKCEKRLSYQPLNQMNVPVCELENSVHSVTNVVNSNGCV